MQVYTTQVQNITILREETKRKKGRVDAFPKQVTSKSPQYLRREGCWQMGLTIRMPLFRVMGKGKKNHKQK